MEGQEKLEERIKVTVQPLRHQGTKKGYEL